MANLLAHTWFIILLAAILIGAVLSAVHHAEVIAHKTGEPFGTLVLSISVTIIEVSLIIAMMLSGHEGSEFIARDAVFATVMIVINGVIGLCIFMGGFKHHEMGFRNEGTNSALGSALASIGLTIPTVAAIAIYFNLQLSLGISALNMTLMYLSFFIGALTLAIGRTTMLQGVVHLIIFFEYLFLSLVP